MRTHRFLGNIKKIWWVGVFLVNSSAIIDLIVIRAADKAEAVSIRQHNLKIEIDQQRFGPN